MPRYHFHILDGIDKLDAEGLEMSGIADARAKALELAGEIIRDAGRRADLGEEWRVTVTDDAGLTLFIIDFLVAESPATSREKPKV